MIERSNFHSAGERPIPASAPPEFRRRIVEIREARNAAPAVEPEDKEGWELLQKFAASTEVEQESATE